MNHNNSLGHTTAPAGPLPNSAKPRKWFRGKSTALKDDARKKFNPNAELKKIETCFSGFAPIEGSNVYVELDLDLLDRVDQIYIQHALRQAGNFSYSEAKTRDLRIETQLLSRCALFKKLVTATPASQKNRIRHYSVLSAGDLFIPKNLSVLIENIGKTDDDDFAIRIKDNIYTIHTLGLSIVKLFSHHSVSKSNHDAVTLNGFNALELDKVHYGDQASTDRLRSKAAELLNFVYENDFTVTTRDNNGNITATFNVSYPRLSISNEQDEMVDIFIEWVAKLHESMPNVVECIHAGLLTICQRHWFTDRNFHTRISELMPQLGLNAFEITPATLLNYVGWQRLDYSDSSVNNTYLSILTEAFSHMFERALVNLGSIFNLCPQPVSYFGTESQLVYHNKSQKRNKRSSFIDNSNYLELTNRATGTSLNKIKDKGLATIALAFGISKSVTYTDMYESRLSSGIYDVRAKLFMNDLIYR